MESRIDASRSVSYFYRSVDTEDECLNQQCASDLQAPPPSSNPIAALFIYFVFNFFIYLFPPEAAWCVIGSAEINNSAQCFPLAGAPPELSVSHLVRVFFFIFFFSSRPLRHINGCSQAGSSDDQSAEHGRDKVTMSLPLTDEDEGESRQVIGIGIRGGSGGNGSIDSG